MRVLPRYGGANECSDWGIITQAERKPGLSLRLVVYFVLLPQVEATVRAAGK